jgi:hypothetical protein
MTSWVTKSPGYTKYRTVSANDSSPVTEMGKGINTEGYEKCNIQVIPDTGEDPTVAILWWSQEKGQFIQEHTAISKAGVGAGTSFEFTIECNGRIFFPFVSGLTTLGVKIMVSGFNRVDPT